MYCAKDGSFVRLRQCRRQTRSARVGGKPITCGQDCATKLLKVGDVFGWLTITDRHKSEGSRRLWHLVFVSPAYTTTRAT